VKDQRSHSDHDRSVSHDGGPTPEQIERWRQLDAEAANRGLREVQELIAEVRRDMAAAGITGPHLISVDELRAAGALDVPPAWRKSLGADAPPNVNSSRDWTTTARCPKTSNPRQTPARAQAAEALTSNANSQASSNRPTASPPTKSPSCGKQLPHACRSPLLLINLRPKSPHHRRLHPPA
jgi:hypothetical protein